MVADAASGGRRPRHHLFGGRFRGFIVPLAYAWSKSRYGSIEPALQFYVAFFVVLLVVTWFCYLRKGSRMAQALV